MVFTATSFKMAVLDQQFPPIMAITTIALNWAKLSATIEMIDLTSLAI
jgi:hypothetical protein